MQVVPEVTSTPCKTDSPDELELAYPEIFPVCVTTHAMSAKRNVEGKPPSNQSDIPLYETFMAQGDVNFTGFGKMFLSREQLLLEQKQDPTLSPMFEDVVPDETLSNVASGYFD